MKKIAVCFLSITMMLVACKKKEDSSTASANISSTVVTNLVQVSSDFTPDSLASSTASSSSLKQQSNPCAGTSDFAVCQSNLIREYVKLGKDAVDLTTQLVSSVGSALGEVADGSTGTTSDSKVTWSKTDANNWSALFRGTGGASALYISIVNNTYTLKANGSVLESDPSSFTVEATINYTDSNTWTVNVFFVNTECKVLDPKAPSKVLINLSKENGLWTGKSMIYAPRFEAPGQTVTCSTTAGASDVVMYTDFVGNDSSTKASLYMAPGSASTFTSSPSSFDLKNICSTLSLTCNGAGSNLSSSFSSLTFNPWCTTGPGVAPTWNNSCSSNSTVSSASYSAASNWIEPATLKAKTTTLPTSL